MIRHEELRRSVVDANRAIAAAQLVILTFGNVSAVDRSAGVMAIKPSGVAYEELTPASIVIVDLESGAVVDGALRPSSDTPTHLVLYQSFDGVGAIVHTHSPAATAWAQTCRELPCLGTTHADYFRGPVPQTRFLTGEETDRAYERCTGDAIVEAFSSRGVDPLETPAVLVASHGPFTWGATVEDAVESAIALEAVASMAINSLRLDPALPAAPMTLVDHHFRRKHGPTASYGQVK